MGMGALIDTWVGWQEIIFGEDYAPIVQVKLRGVQDIHVAMKYLEPLTHIEDLCLDGTSVTDGDLECIQNMKSLVSLDLSNNPITDAGLERLERLTRLRFLTLDNTQTTDAGVKRLCRKLPRLQVKRASAKANPPCPNSSSVP